MTAETTLSTFTATDGNNVMVQDWLLDPNVKLRGVVIIVHGLGEHAGRYDHVARQLNAWGFAVRGYDQCGHGESHGARGSLPTDTRLLDDLADIVDSTRARTPKGIPLILLGHSMGGLVVGRFVSLGLRKVDGLVMSSPALDAGMNAFQKFLVSVLPKIAPDLRVGNGVKPQFVSHDPAVVAAYKADPLVHDRISARLARFIAEAGPQTLALAPQWKVPTLLMYAGDDRLLNADGSREFAKLAPKDVVTTQCFDALYHEIFNELDAKPVFDALKQWLDKRF
ncbi:alpha/beta hydrolase [Rhodoferax sp. AJA081-3]|uniref:alpha/beta hydrolase n=1 Tax=Rhodoferax sp. AJA081-3 TaxID=2752316 RepID=UPI001ADF69F9|nr:alpha/beta hydrolase [Rhodoferax sp. AJA081-3]QTN26670.1 alpha/beta hydrolase [Rhodoferax sp. AJA081-3]